MTAASGPPEWDCEAYGPGSRSFGALCFFAEQGERACASPDECRQAMAGARQVLFQRMNELAAHNPGDRTWKYLAETFASPGQLLGGGDPPPPGPDGEPDAVLREASARPVRRVGMAGLGC